jgi:hypothetical protein
MLTDCSEHANKSDSLRLSWAALSTRNASLSPQ